MRTLRKLLNKIYKASLDNEAEILKIAYLLPGFNNKFSNFTKKRLESEMLPH